jgi:glycosyltransferase involved in cell wall biosynthesis
VLYDYLQTIGGGERVAFVLAKHFDADLITSDCDPGLAARAGYAGVRVTSLGPLPRIPPFKQIEATRKFARARLRGYDFYILSGNWAQYAAKHHHPNIYYCLTPTRMFYDQREATLRRHNFVGRGFARSWIRIHRSLDSRAVAHCDRIVAISENVRKRVQRFYGHDPGVIYPPVATSRFRFKELGDFWLSVSRMYPEKRIELQLEIFRQLPRERLVLVGGYSAGDLAERYLAGLRPPPNVTLLGEVAENRLLDLYSRCRGFLTTAVDEDFGITPVEAMAAGKCVLATDEGGYRETVIPGKTGFLLPPEANQFAAKIRELDNSTLDSMRAACLMRARAFDETVFLKKMTALIDEVQRNRPGVPS